MSSGAKPEAPTARELAEAVFAEQGYDNIVGRHGQIIEAVTAAIEARDAANAREVAELRAKVIDECARAALAHDTGMPWAPVPPEAVSRALIGAAARIRALRGKVEP